MVHIFFLDIGVGIRWLRYPVLWQKCGRSSHQKWEFPGIIYILGLSTFCDRDIDRQYISREFQYTYIYISGSIASPTGLSLTWHGHGGTECIQMSSWCFIYMSVSTAHKSPTLSYSLFWGKREEKFLNRIIKQKKKN